MHWVLGRHKHMVCHPRSTQLFSDQPCSSSGSELLVCAAQAMIISILFFEMSLSTALWTGIIVGIGTFAVCQCLFAVLLARLPVMASNMSHAVVENATMLSTVLDDCLAGYTLFVRAMYRQQLAQAAQEAARVAGGGSPSVHAPPPVMHQMIV